MQAYSDLRYPLFPPAAETGWPGWLDEDERRRGQMEMALAKELITRHPAGYLRLWLRDWLSLQLYPAYWPAWLARRWATAPPSRLSYARQLLGARPLRHPGSQPAGASRRGSRQAWPALS